ncbi:dynamin family protein [[Phormidium ambiguum] IAM M-71]|uniref:Dynamin family protein n=1 Tax=[Phormidium ambiguum] IAM M-71 TaxID=454136 RepID=A0A1U7ITS6_9CYAN|nr:dynamin family protein [Phormidium ambiguum]OKH40848.1 dynamin family protein [Phormidium ambiguum IAM M-71]
MVAEVKKPNIQSLQTNAIDLLGQVGSLLHRVSTALSSDTASEKYAKFQREVADATRNVSDLELRMAIVAPMKAGKSTIINAIVGQELLPSRNAAMTTLPTEIIFDPQLAEPVLVLTQQIQDIFRDTFTALQRKITELGLDRVQERMAQYPHLAKLPEKIQGMTGIAIDSKISGRLPIINSLRALNDIIRLCSVLDPLSDPLQSLIDVPRIYSPFYRSGITDRADIAGKLVIVDTPGPNEAGENLKLVNVVAEQLQASSVILIVLNFTELNTKAEDEIKKDVARVIELRGKDNLYVLVNKVDQRKEGDMTPEQVRQFVAAEFGIGDGEQSDRVFEISARWAFSAANFLGEVQQRPGVDVAQLRTARSLAQDVFPLDWEEELQETTVNQLQKKAEKLWNKSGFDLFLTNAVNALMTEAAPRCITSSLKIAKGRLLELLEDTQLRSRAINEDGEKLRLEVAALDEDIHSIENCRNSLQEIEQIKIDLQEKLNKILENLQQEGKLSVETYLLQEDPHVADFVAKGGTTGKVFANWIAQQKQEVATESKRLSSMEFTTLRDAEEFAGLAVAYAKRRVDLLLEKVQENSVQVIDEARQKMMNFLDEQTKPIIDRARERLNENFHLNLSLPNLRFQSDYYIDLNKPLVIRHTRKIDQGYSEVVRTKRSFLHFLWLVPFEVTEKVRRPHKTENFYTVSLQGIIYEINKLIDQRINDIKNGISQYLDEDFQQRIDDFFNDLDTYLNNYRNSLKQAQVDQQLSIEAKTKLTEALNSLVPEVKEQVKKADAYLNYMEELVPKK